MKVAWAATVAAMLVGAHCIEEVWALGGKKEATVYWSWLDDGVWRVIVAATDEGAFYVDAGVEAYKGLLHAVRRMGGVLREDADKVAPYVAELREYFAGTRREFSVPLQPVGTPFQQAVWQQLRHIPYGRSTSYAAVAEAIDRPRAVRAVGGAIGANPLMFLVPCHRVVGKDGSLTGFGGGLPMKKRLLALEADGTGA